MAGLDFGGLVVVASLGDDMPCEGVEGVRFGVDVRNRDGLIVISDMRSGLWLFHLKGFNGWNGHTYGMPDISSVQDYVHGPDGAPPPGTSTVGSAGQ